MPWLLRVLGGGAVALACYQVVIEYCFGQMEGSRCVLAIVVAKHAGISRSCRRACFLRAKFCFHFQRQAHSTFIFLSPLLPSCFTHRAARVVSTTAV